MAKSLREWRDARDLTQYQLANKAGVAVSTVVGIEANGHHPHVGIAAKLAEALGISIDDVEWPPMKATGYGVPRPRRKRAEGSEASE